MNHSLPALAFVLCAPLAAQGLLIGPDSTTLPPPPPGQHTAPRHGGVQIVRTGVQAEIVDGVATTTIDQVFHNSGSRDAEGTWFLPLPMGAVADGFTMTVGGKEVKGEVLDAGQARAVYETIVRQRRDPGLLEYAGEGMLRARIFPIPANGEVGVTIRLRQVIQPMGGMFEWVWPLRAASLGDAIAGPIGLHVRIQSQGTISTVVTPHPGAEIRRIGDREATVGLEGEAAQFEDLRVLYGLAQSAFGLHLLANRPLGEPGYFTLLLSPPRALPAGQAPPRRFVQFVVDTSGSMAGDKLTQAKAALRTFVSNLRQNDVFQVVTFASSVQTFFGAPVLASSENTAAALARVDGLQALGGTNIAGALQQALAVAVPSDDGAVLLPQIVFVTDGQPTVGPTNPQQILDLTKQLDTKSTRIFALGVGNDIDVRLIDDLVQQHRGARDFVRNQEKLEVKVDALCQKLAQPALTDVEVRCDGLDSFAVHPTRTPDLFCGDMLQVVGRYRNGGKQTVKVRGRHNGADREYAFDVEFPQASEQHAFVQTLWARQHTATLLDAIRRNGAAAELVDEVKRLATRYGIVTPYTSQLIVEEGRRLGAPIAGAPTPGPGGPHGPRGSSRGAPGAPGDPVTPAAAATPGAEVWKATGKSLTELGRNRTGEQAVEESLAVQADSLLGGSRRAGGRGGRGDQALVRRANGRVFVPAGDDLVEQGLPADWAKQAVVIEAFGTEYFELLRQQPELRQLLALGDRIVFRCGPRIVHVRPTAPVAPKPEPQPAR